MNQKKCPKCGENNPVEGVMCWACYTPLSGGASAVAKAGAPASISAAPVASEKEKTKITPVQMGVLGVGLLVILGMGLRSLGGGASSSDDTGLPPVPGGPPGGFRIPVIPQRSGGGATVSPTAPLQPQVQTGDVFPYSVTTPPSSKSNVATIGIVPSVEGTDRVTGARLASQAHERYARSGRWQGIYVYAFADRQTAGVFQKYQQNRRGAPLEPSDYEDPNLQSIWPKTLARYEYVQGKEAIRYPQSDPSGWFRGESKWSAVKP